MIEKSAIVKTVTMTALLVLTLVLCQLFPNAATDPQTGMLLALPDEMKGHHVQVIQPSDDEKEWLPEDTGIMKRQYVPYGTQNERHKWLHATLILSGNDPRSLHRPEVCLDGQGWLITERKVMSIPINGQDLEVMDFTIERTEQTRSGERYQVLAHYVYWWIGKDRSTPHDWQRILYSDWDNLTRNINNRWGYPSVMVQVDPSMKPEEGHHEARQRAYRWIQKYAPMFQKSLAPADESETPDEK